MGVVVQPRAVAIEAKKCNTPTQRKLESGDAHSRHFVMANNL
jgi:hypothetical protein